jgi:hypothetical protein
MRVLAFEEVNFPIALPFFNLSLASQSRFGGLVSFVPDEPVDVVPFRKARDDFVLMLPNAPQEIGCRSEIEGPIGFTGEEIDVKHLTATRMGPGLRREIR